MDKQFTYNRDFELCRKILSIATNLPADEIYFQPISIPGYDEETVSYHIWLLGDGGYLDVIDARSKGSGFRGIMIRTVTWKGHEFISALENETVWKKFKSLYLDKGIEMPFTLAKEVAMGILKNQVGL